MTVFCIGGDILKRNNQLIALFVFIPMLLFTLFITVMTQKHTTPYDEAKTVIYKYFNYRNSKDMNSLSSILVNKDILNSLESEINETQKISIISVSEEENDSIKKVYLRNDVQSSTKNVKVFKVSYEIQYKSKELSYKDGVYNSWYFLTRENENSNWLIDIFDA